jgi:hypothetical protein
MDSVPVAVSLVVMNRVVISSVTTSDMETLSEVTIAPVLTIGLAVGLGNSNRIADVNQVERHIDGTEASDVVAVSEVEIKLINSSVSGSVKVAVSLLFINEVTSTLVFSDSVAVSLTAMPLAVNPVTASVKVVVSDVFTKLVTSGVTDSVAVAVSETLITNVGISTVDDSVAVMVSLTFTKLTSRVERNSVNVAVSDTETLLIRSIVKSFSGGNCI